MKIETVNFILDIIDLAKEHGTDAMRREFAILSGKKKKEIAAGDMEVLKKKKIQGDHEFLPPGINP